MRTSMIAILAMSCFCVLGGIPANAQKVRDYEENGITYRETRTKATRPVAETTYQDRQQTVYRQRYTTQLHDHLHTTMVPVTDYRWETRLHNWWNPFKTNTVGYHLVPHRRWEARTETIRTPVTTRQLIPEVQTVKVPVTTLRMVEQEHVTRVAISPQDRLSPNHQRFSAGISQSDTNIARRIPIGGISLESDPPRRGTALPGDDEIRR